MPKKKEFAFYEAINEAIDLSMKKDKNLICYGLGVTDPKNVFSTTKNLEKKYGKKRVFDVPTSENALTGISIGAALNGTRSVVTHQRLDFFLLAMDQLVNSAAKWYYMFGSKKSVPITIRLILGRGWGQGPTHSQNLQAWFNHIPGLKVVMPSFADDAKGLLISSILDPNPVIFLEHRWLHNTKSFRKNDGNKIKIGKAKVCTKGKDITIISMSYLTLEAIKAADFLRKNFQISAEVIDLRSIKPMDWSTLFKSIKKTKRVIICDTGFSTNSVASEIIAKISTDIFHALKSPPVKLAMPDIPEPTSLSLIEDIYITAETIAKNILNVLNIKHNKNSLKKLKNLNPADVPDPDFKGPF